MQLYSSPPLMGVPPFLHFASEHINTGYLELPIYIQAHLTNSDLANYNLFLNILDCLLEIIRH